MTKLSRRLFLKLSGASAAGALLTTAGCAPTVPQAPAGEPTTEPEAVEPAAQKPAGSEPGEAAEPTTTARPTATPTTPPPQKAYRRPGVIRFFPDQKSQVVRARSVDVWAGDALDPAVVAGMVERAVMTLTGQPDPKSAWLALFEPGEKIAIKVNAFRNSLIWTHPVLVQAVTDGLQAAGIPGEDITIFDFWTSELETAGFTINEDGPGVRCYGTDDRYTTSWDIGPATVRLSDVLLECDALINVPVLKSHMMAGLTFALKNHYGSVSFPDGLHNIPSCLPALNALAPIREATRLVIGDALEANTKYASSFPYWSVDARGDSILMSYDPLAQDRVALDMLVALAEEKGNSTGALVGMAERWLETALGTGLGTGDKEQIDLVEV
jgi:hypothetical protein